MRQPFLGEGWAFPISPAQGKAPGAVSAGAIATASDEEKIRQSIWIILTTAPGERMMVPDFGCGIQDRVFENLDEASIGQLLHDVADALARWEPRIDVVGLDAKPDQTQPNLLLISVDYRIRSTNSRFNFVYPFYVS